MPFTNSTLSIIGIIFTLLLLSSCSLSAFSKNSNVRTPGSKLDDKLLPKLIKKELIKKNPTFAKARIKVYSYNQFILLTGEILSEQMIQDANIIISNIKSVRHFFNRLKLQTNIGGLIKVNDLWIENRIKTELYLTNVKNISDIKIISEDGHVYLMGLVTKQKANKIQKVAQSISGVRSIELLFEYTE